MATVRSIVIRAYRMAGIVPLSDEPEASELNAGVDVLQSIYDRVAANRDLTPVLKSGTYEAKEDERITGATTVTLPTSVVDSVTGETRAPLDMAYVQYDTGSGFVTYASDRGSWVRTDALTASSEAPFSDRNSEGLSALVALEFAETYPGATVGPMTVRKARIFQSLFTREPTIEPEYY